LKDQLLPTTISISVGAALAGLSRETFCSRCIGTGLVAVDTDRRVLVASLAAYLGEAISIDALLLADHRLEPARRTARIAQRNRRSAA
jgi:hypothetical protein